MYTYNLQYVDFRTDQVKEMGPVDAAGAIKAFASFPFKEQLEKAQGLPEPTFPTISFRSHDDGAALAVWSLEPNVYEIYMENKGEKVTLNSKGDDLVIEAIGSFFSGSRSELFNRLSSVPGAVTKRGFLNRLNLFFWLGMV